MLKHAPALLAFLAAAPLASAQPALDCQTGHVSVQAASETKALLASLNEAIDRQREKLDADIGKAAARARWSEQDRARFFQTVLRSPPNLAFERRIESLTSEMRAMLQASQQGEIKGPVADCRHVARLRELVGQLASVYEKQTTYLTQQLRNVAAQDR